MDGVEHHTKKGGKWRKATLEPHGDIDVVISTDEEGYKSLNKPVLKFNGQVKASGDTGAQMCVGGRDIMSELKINEKDILRAKMKIKVADSRQSNVLGVIFAEVSGINKKTRELRNSHQMIYFIDGVKGLYLSKDCCRDLGLVSFQYPCIADEKTGRRGESFSSQVDREEDDGQFSKLAEEHMDGHIDEQVPMCKKMQQYCNDY